jgi:hypothetical protein
MGGCWPGRTLICAAPGGCVARDAASPFDLRSFHTISIRMGLTNALGAVRQAA